MTGVQTCALPIFLGEERELVVETQLVEVDQAKKKVFLGLAGGQSEGGRSRDHRKKEDPPSTYPARPSARSP